MKDGVTCGTGESENAFFPENSQTRALSVRKVMLLRMLPITVTTLSPEAVYGNRIVITAYPESQNPQSNPAT